MKLGPAVLVGVSADVPSTSHIPRALEQATLALECANVADRVMQYTEIPMQRMMLRHARDELRAALPTWATALHNADEKMRGALGETLRGYADADMNVLQAAKKLNVHPNTIYARANKIQDLTGKNALTYHGLTELLLAMDCREV